MQILDDGTDIKGDGLTGDVRVTRDIVEGDAGVRPRVGLVITRSVRLLPGRYRLTAPRSLDSAVIVVRGDNITLDMRDVILEGTAPTAEPDEGRGVAIRSPWAWV